ncbi:hypothetical protein EDD21DRAFT_108505 [Dissophora ornata]|nr:hypothetical protein EDD21DRAFT_108505 [Dissophora ornata]
MSQFASPNLSRDRITISGRSGRLGIFRKGKASRKTVVQGGTRILSWLVLITTNASIQQTTNLTLSSLNIGDEFSEDAFLNQKAGSRLSEGRNDQQEAIVMSAYFTPQQSSLHKPFLPQSVENPSDDDSSRSYKARHPIHSSESRSFEALVNSEGGSKAKDCAISSHSSNDHEGPSDRSEPNLDRQTLSHRSLSLGLSIEALVGGSLETNNTIGGDHVEFPADSDAYQSLYYPTVSTVDPVMLSVQPQVETAPSCVHPQLPSNPIYYPSLYFMHEIPAEMVQTSQYNLPTAPNYRPEPYGYAYDILVDPYTTQRHHPDLYNEYLKEFEDVARESEDSGLNPSENSRSTPPSAQALFQWRPRRLF